MLDRAVRSRRDHIDIDVGVFAHPHDGAFAISLFDGLDCVLERGFLRFVIFNFIGHFHGPPIYP
jgi:hypothetical protein